MKTYRTYYEGQLEHAPGVGWRPVLQDSQALTAAEALHTAVAVLHCDPKLLRVVPGHVGGTSCTNLGPPMVYRPKGFMIFAQLGTGLDHHIAAAVDKGYRREPERSLPC